LIFFCLKIGTEITSVIGMAFQFQGLISYILLLLLCSLNLLFIISIVILHGLAATPITLFCIRRVSLDPKDLCAHPKLMVTATSSYQL